MATQSLPTMATQAPPSSSDVSKSSNYRVGCDILIENGEDMMPSCGV